VALAKVVDVKALREALREAGLRATGPRVAVMKSLVSASGPVSHGELAAQLADDGLDRATVFRNLKDLTDAGLVRRTDLGDHTWRFELKAETHAAEDDPHAHFMCDACGDVVCLPDETVQIVAAKGAPRAIKKKEFEVQIKGRCDRCA
jgi:Fur family ferric uptake transcriptional regulator